MAAETVFGVSFAGCELCSSPTDLLLFYLGRSCWLCPTRCCQASVGVQKSSSCSIPLPRSPVMVPQSLQGQLRDPETEFKKEVTHRMGGRAMSWVVAVHLWKKFSL